MSLLLTVLLLPALGDTTRVAVGSPLVNGSVYAPHKARVRAWIGDSATTPTSEWINELTLGDSAGRKVMRWVTTGTQRPPGGAPITWELRQTYDAMTLAPLGYASKSSVGGFSSLRFEGSRVHGTRKTPRDSAPVPFELTLERPGFIASASDLVPLAVGLKAGAVIAAPVWSPGMKESEMRVFSVLGKGPVKVEGTEVDAWKVEERKPDGSLYATWWLTERSPYMVYGEVNLPDGRVQRLTEVEVR